VRSSGKAVKVERGDGVAELLYARAPICSAVRDEPEQPDQHPPWPPLTRARTWRGTSRGWSTAEDLNGPSQPSGPLEQESNALKFSSGTKERARACSLRDKGAPKALSKVAEMLSRMLSQISGEEKDGWLMSF